MLRSLQLILAIGISFCVSAQTVIIPGYTGYAVPAEKDESSIFSEKNGVQQWKDGDQQIQYFFYVRKPGKLSVSLDAKSATEGTILKITVLGKDFPVKIPASSKFKIISAGTVTVKDSGFYSITISVTQKARNSIADIRSVQLSGTASAGVQYNPKPRRNAASVHLRYPIEDSVKAIAFYNEITIPNGFDHLHSYYMACGFARGYFGIQVNRTKSHFFCLGCR
jgi:hypothetical protein